MRNNVIEINQWLKINKYLCTDRINVINTMSSQGLADNKSTQ